MCCVRSETSDNRCFQSVGPSAGREDHRGLGGALSFASCFLTLPLCVLPGLYWVVIVILLLKHKDIQRSPRTGEQ